jgi:hypothetical protein
MFVFSENIFISVKVADPYWKLERIANLKYIKIPKCNSYKNNLYIKLIEWGLTLI